MLIYTLDNPSNTSIGLEIAMQILYQLALGPLLAATLSFLNGHTLSSTNSSNGRRSLLNNLPRLLKLVHLVIIAALVLRIVGGVDRAPKSSIGTINPAQYDKGATLLQASSALFLIALVGIAYGAARFWPDRAAMTEPQSTLLPAVIFAIPLLLLRVIYSLLSSTNLDTTKSTGHSTEFNIFTGSWAVYLVMAMLPQFGIVIAYSVAGFVADRRESINKNLFG